MFYLLSLVAGALISVMVAFNGGLTERYGVYSATVIIHLVGLAVIAAIMVAKREKFFPARFAWFMYLGGAIGVLTTVFNNFSFGRISVSAILALGLLGQSAAGLIIDKYGLFGMHKYPFSREKFFGLALILAGIAAMVNSFEIAAVVVSFLAGVNIVLSRTFNAKLSERTNVRVSTFYNYAVGLVGAILVFILMGGNEALLPDFMSDPLSADLWIYLGGVLGVCVVLFFNILVVKISAFYLTLLVFIGQVFTGVAIDAVLTGGVSIRNVIGGVLVAAGLSVNLVLDNRKEASQSR
jgi:transporter family-2 protein